MKLSVRVFDRVVEVGLSFFRKRTIPTYGVGNRCEDGRFVLFLDYDLKQDDLSLEWVKDEIIFLQDYFGIGDCFIFQTKRGYHVINFEKRSIAAIVDLMRQSTCDQAYKDTPLYLAKKVWILRFSLKRNETRRYIGVVKAGQYCTCEWSSPHVAFVRDFYSIPTEDLSNFIPDRTERLLFAQYFVSEAKA